MESSVQPPRGLGREALSRQQRTREALEEARLALRETSGLAAAPPYTAAARARRRISSTLRRLARSRGPRQPDRRPSLALWRHLPTLVVLALLGLTAAGQALGFSFVAAAAPSGGEGGILVLTRGPEAPAAQQAFAFAAAPMQVARRQSAAVDASLAAESPASPDNISARSEVVTHTVAAAETLEGIAAQFEVTAYTIFWVNELASPGDLRPGMVLLIPPLSGVPHAVRQGETLDSVADMYGVRTGNIVGYAPNGIMYPYHLTAGQEIFVPGGIVEIPSYRVAAGQRPPPTLVKMPGGEKLSWPTWGEITGPFGWSRVYGGYHQGLDIANNWGTPIRAAAAGEVIEAGWGGLGWYVVIDHGNGFRTEYGHMARPPLVSAGDMVERDQQLGLMGETYGSGGWATGVHLHFAVRHRGVYIDPLPLLEQ